MEKKVNSNVKVAVVAAILVGLLSMVAIHKYISVKTAGQEIPETTIMIAATAIEKGEEFTDLSFGTARIPSKAVSNMHVVLPKENSEDFATSFSKAKMKFTGKKSGRPIAPETPVFWIDLEEPADTQVDDLIPQQNRAVTLPVDHISSVSNFIRPGSKVDVVLTVPANMLGVLPLNKEMTNSASEESSHTVTMMIMQNIPVIAVGRNFSLNSISENDYSSITLNVTPEEALLLVQARTMGALTFMLRNLNDKQIRENLNNTLIQPGNGFMQQLITVNQKRRQLEREAQSPKVKVNNNREESKK